MSVFVILCALLAGFFVGMFFTLWCIARADARHREDIHELAELLFPWIRP